MFRIYLLVIFLLKIRENRADCRQSFIIQCDNLNDYLNYETYTWRQLIIGNVNYAPIEQWTMFNMWFYLVQDLDKLESLTIINQFHGKFDDEIAIVMINEKLHYLNLYKNNLETLYINMFRLYRSLIELNLINNNIKQIVPAALFYNIDTINLSENHVAEIKEWSFSNGPDIRRFIMKSNRLTIIEQNAFPRTLELLYLDFNEFTYVPEECLENLESLKELTMSHNKITYLPSDLSYLKSIEKLDFSYNRIINIRTNFEKFTNLQHINLSHNSIKKINFISLIPNNNFTKKISIAFNHITQFILTRDEWKANFTSPITLILFGNPWICECLNDLQEFIRDRPFRRDVCDLKLFGTGRLPTCVEQVSCAPILVAFNLSFFRNFEENLNETRKYFPCNIDTGMMNLERKRITNSVYHIENQTRYVGGRLVPTW